jgi:hypothetical protein
MNHLENISPKSAEEYSMDTCVSVDLSRVRLMMRRNAPETGCRQFSGTHAISSANLTFGDSRQTPVCAGFACRQPECAPPQMLRGVVTGQAFGEGASCNMEIDFSLLRGTRHSYRLMQVAIFHANAQE